MTDFKVPPDNDSMLPEDFGPADCHQEGSYRRGYHQAVAAVADALRSRNLSADELESWVLGAGMDWRKSLTLDRMILPPSLYNQGH
ncbi:hypothetical protein [Pseudoduganella violaceinigra]|uniref:hypothetical protein n=1 Tax=Pseudoduganella violaceinigra TaxID=246602 RepID=UPI0012B57B21|nr:hypothetical protein [Pseudoduganella violaceinigra]